MHKPTKPFVRKSVAFSADGRLRNQGLARLDKAGAFRGSADTGLYPLSSAGAKRGEVSVLFDLAASEAAVIVDLAAALVVSRLTAAEAFRLGTSPEAIALFEETEARRDVAQMRCRIAAAKIAEEATS
jgi:hypothetical protein